MNLNEEITRINASGYSELNAQSKLGQDIILKAISDSGMARNATIKGGVVMFNNPAYLKGLRASDKNWLDISADKATEKILSFSHFLILLFIFFCTFFKQSI